MKNRNVEMSQRTIPGPERWQGLRFTPPDIRRYALPEVKDRKLETVKIRRGGLSLRRFGRGNGSHGAPTSAGLGSRSGPARCWRSTPRKSRIPL